MSNEPEKLARVEGSLERKYAALQDYDKTIQETCASFSRILDSSRVLLNSVRNDSHHLQAHAGGGGAPGDGVRPHSRQRVHRTQQQLDEQQARYALLYGRNAEWFPRTCYRRLHGSPSKSKGFR